MDRSDSLDLNYVGQPNVNAQGIINDAFNDEQDKSESQIEKTDKEATERKLSVDIAEVAIENLQPNSLRELVDNNMDFQEQTADIEESIHESNDPFDTKGFDSKAFEAFESRFEATDNKEKIVRIDDDPFASPYKTAKSNADQDGSGGFDTFEPFVPKQPENTPYKVAKKPKKKKDSFEDSDSFDDDDDDEPEESFRIVIRAKNNDTQRSEANSNLGKNIFVIEFDFFMS